MEPLRIPEIGGDFGSDRVVTDLSQIRTGVREEWTNVTSVNGAIQ